MDEKKIVFSSNFICPWLKGSISVDDKVVKVVTPNTLLELIPAGKSDKTLPLKNVGSVSVTTGFNGKMLLIGIICILLSFSFFDNNIFTALYLIFAGVAIFGNGIITYFTINGAGAEYYVKAACYSKKQMVYIRKEIENALLIDIDKTDIGKHVQEQADAHAEAIARVFKKEF